MRRAIPERVGAVLGFKGSCFTAVQGNSPQAPLNWCTGGSKLQVVMGNAYLYTVMLRGSVT